jgi:GDPmannose 4,6-dehydratase
MKHALITGITGQDGSYLAEYLLGKPDYVVHGLVRRSSTLNRQRIDHLSADPTYRDRFHLHYADLADASSMAILMEQVRPDEVYNLGAQSHVRVSFDQPLYTSDVVGLGTLRILEAVRQLSRSQDVKFYQASSSEMFGSAPPPQTLQTPFHPRSPYACAKLYGHWQTINYREAYGLFACSGILFNHESPAAASRSSPARSRWAPPGSRRACSASSSWATSTPSATGATPATTSAPCG